MLKYNYVYFNITDNRKKKNPNGYNAICATDLEKLDDVQVVSFPLDYASEFVKWLFRMHHSGKINDRIKLPFKKIWFPFYFKKRFENKKPICFVVSGTYLPVEYLQYLRKKYPNAKFVRIYRDLIRLFFTRNPQYSPELFSEIFDIQMSYDEGEAAKYGILHFTEFESKIDISMDKDYPLYDVLFVGAAKDRMGKLMDAYHKFTAAGLKCFYYLTGVPDEQRIPYEGIEYGDRYMPYYEMLYKTVNSRCVLEINQEGAVGYTSRFLEAVIYGKKLITNNPSIKASKFYDERFICCVNDIDEIYPSFVMADVGEVDYHYCGEFSPVRLIEQIDRELDNMDA